MEEVRIKVLREIRLDKNLQPIEGKQVFNNVYLICDEEEVFLGSVDTAEELATIIHPEGIKDIYYNYLDEKERLIFAKAFKKTDGIYTFNDEKFSVKEIMKWL